MNDEIFVFGSNLGGIHGRGSALAALKYHGAIKGVGVGRQGMSYAIPTKDKLLRVLSLAQIKPFVNDFIAYAGKHTELTFRVVAIGCGLAGYTPEQIAPLFAYAPSNVLLPYEFVKVLAARKGTIR